MMQMTTTHELLKPLTNSLGRVQIYRYTTPQQQKCIDEIKRRTSFMNDDYTFMDRVEALKQNLTFAPRCYCGKARHRVTYKTDDIAGFSDFCCQTCMNKADSTKEKRRKCTREKGDAKYKELEWVTKEILIDHFENDRGSVEGFLKKYDIKTPILFRRKMDEHGVKVSIDDFKSNVERLVYSWFPDEKPIVNKPWFLDSGWEIDLMYMDKKVAVELNGIYWHSEISGGRGKKFHVNKLIECEKKGIKLLQFWDSQIKKTPDIVRSIIGNALGKNQKLFARKCTVYSPTKSEEREFFGKNHLQGFIGSSSCLALKDESGEIVSMISFGKSRFSKNEIEVLRFCHRLGTTVVGGLSKLITNSDYDNLITYVDRMWANGEGYKKVGFVEVNESSPCYYYVKNRYDLIHRVSFQKHKLPKVLDTFDPNLSEWENMKANGWDRVWDCGTKKLKWSRNDK